MPSWVVSSLIATASITIMMLLFKKLTIHNISPISINFYFFLLVTAGFFAFMLIAKAPFSLPASSLWIFVVLAAFAISFNYFEIVAIRDAPNPGFVESITSFRLVAIALLSTFIFNAELTAKNLAGIVFVIVGLVLIST
ncbi:EamA family transporter [Thiorhodococcus fuscus]|uniref:EamA family transporter n=1 Tax=Thiorhodococcus fuscus TaxID=527200 RepID=A0ABW4Y773_9GAMM